MPNLKPSPAQWTRQPFKGRGLLHAEQRYVKVKGVWQINFYGEKGGITFSRPAKPNEVVIIEQLYEARRAPVKMGVSRGWTPVEKNVPQSTVGVWFIPVLVSLANGDVIAARFDTQTALWMQGKNPLAHVLAWQYLPKPYTGAVAKPVSLKNAATAKV